MAPMCGCWRTPRVGRLRPNGEEMGRRSTSASAGRSISEATARSSWPETRFSDELGRNAFRRAKYRRNLLLVSRHGEILELESRAYRTAHQAVFSRRASGLPPASRDSPHRPLSVSDRSQTVRHYLGRVRRCHPEVERRAFVEV